MRALVVYESMFGDNRQVAEQVAAGLTESGVAAEAVEVGVAPTAVPDDVDLVARVSYEKADYDRIGDGDGYGVEVGVRAALTPAFEASAGVRHRDVDFDGEIACIAIVPVPPACQFAAEADGSDTAFFVGGQYKFNPQWGIAAEVSFSDADNRVFVGPRISF